MKKVINPYLNFNGKTEEAFNFYKSVFGGEFTSLMRFGETPGCEDMPVTEKDGIMHISYQIGSTMLMASDVPSSMEQVKFGSSVSLCINVEAREEADRIFNGLSEGGNVSMPMQDMFWGDYFGMLTDKFGIQWMISFNANLQ